MELQDGEIIMKWSFVFALFALILFSGCTMDPCVDPIDPSEVVYDCASKVEPLGERLMYIVECKISAVRR